MNQTGVIFFGLLVGFVVFITVKGQLSAYLNVLGLSGGKSVGSNGSTTNPLYGMTADELGLNGNIYVADGKGGWTVRPPTTR